jgi:protein-disulfide reductase (glutathione)
MRAARFLALLVVAAGVPAYHKEVSGGWNIRIAWNRMSEGLKKARETKKPSLVLIHQSKDGASKALKPLWVKSKEIEEMSSHFVMINAGDHDEPTDSKFRPEGANGGYYPRIIFLRPDGSRIDGIQGPSAAHVAYFSKPPQIVAAMRQALLAVGIDLDAEEKAKQAEAEKAAAEEKEKYRTSVPGMLEAIFAVVDEDRDQKLSHDEYSTFVRATKGQVPTATQYERMCSMHKSVGGLTFEVMRVVYASRSVDELKKLHDKLMVSRAAEL